MTGSGVHEKNLRMERWQGRLFGLAGAALTALAVGVVWVLGVPTLSLFFSHGLLAVLLGREWDPIRGQLGIFPFVLGSGEVTLVALLVAVPLGLATAISVEYIWRPLAGVLSAVLTGLGAVPSVIYGWWALSVLVPLVRTVGGSGFSLLTAGLVVGMMVLPTLGVLSRSALGQVSRDWQEASQALGATPDQTLWRLILPAAAPKIRSAVVVAVARALGETIAVQMVVGGQAYVGLSPLHSGATLTSQIITDLASLPPGTAEHGAVDAMALILLFAMAMVARALVRKEAP